MIPLTSEQKKSITALRMADYTLRVKINRLEFAVTAKTEKTAPIVKELEKCLEDARLDLEELKRHLTIE